MFEIPQIMIKNSGRFDRIGKACPPFGWVSLNYDFRAVPWIKTAPIIGRDTRAARCDR